jgi:hypothetical protein
MVRSWVALSVEQSEKPADEGEGEQVERGDVDFAVHG